MREQLRVRVEDYWRRFLGVDDVESRPSVLLVHRSALAGYPGVFVVLREDQVIASVPPGLAATAKAWPLTRETVADPSWWQDRLPGWAVLGPSVQSFLDHTDALPDTARTRPVGPAEVLRHLRERVTGSEWAESGFNKDLEKAWLLDVEGGRVVAAANLSLFDGVPADVGVLVAGDARGHGYSAVVAATATRHAVHAHAIARWRSLDSNTASRRTAHRLGFQDDCVQLAIRP
ncbi:hypothetical protein GA707_20055 [Nostocoides sp. F2B08]|uniref:GNAT family N-acetyltransferase n=1 Tax=Nostocoides sp. F2B08 TaxID=2653936 RepID=UPI0012634ACB|nr:GNAT family N-acetyltransferase [Tetrasphaera sp. F2B08]KAB7739773.1 hypothetical protein GA707_20055 [Tetrasphaera sp. F2B08]